ARRDGDDVRAVLGQDGRRRPAATAGGHFHPSGLRRNRGIALNMYVVRARHSASSPGLTPRRRAKRGSGTATPKLLALAARPWLASARRRPSSHRRRLLDALPPRGMTAEYAARAGFHFLRNQNRRTRRAAAFEIAVRLLRVLERVFLVHRDFHRAGADLLEQVRGDGEQVFALGGVVVERRPRRKQRAFGLQDIDVESFDLAGRAAEAHEIAERPQAIERGWERGLADAVINHIAELATGDLLHTRDEVLVAIKDGVIAAVLLGELGLVLGADSADHGRAERLRPLAGSETDAAGGSVNENGVALLHLEGAGKQIFDRHALEHHRGGLLVADALRQLHRAVGGQQPLRRIAAERRHIADAITD